MKRLLCCFAIAVLLASSAFAESFDFSAMTTEELLTLRTKIDAELLSRNPPTDGDLICDDSRVRLSLLSYGMVETYSGKALRLVCEWTNKDDEPESLSDWVSVDANSGKRSLTFTRGGMYDIIRANEILTFSFDIEVPNWADVIEVTFRSFWKPSDIFKTYTFTVR